MNRRYIQEVFLREPLDPDSYLNTLPAVRYLLEGNRLSFPKDVTFLVGENGTGKSTLLEALRLPMASMQRVGPATLIFQPGLPTQNCTGI